MRIRALILGLICMSLLSCEKPAESPFSPEPNIQPQYASVEMVGTASWYPEVYTTACDSFNEKPYFGFGGRTDSQGVRKGVLKNTGNKIAYGVRLTVRMYSNANEFLGETTVPSAVGCNTFYLWEYGEDVDSAEYFSYCVLEPGGEVKWIAYLFHEGNDWREEVYWQGVEFIIDWE